MKKYFFIIGLLLYSLSSFTANKIGYIDVENILKNSQSFNEELVQLQASLQKEEEKLRAQLERLKKLAEEYDEIKDDLSSSEKQKRVKSFTAEEQSLQEKASKIRRTFEQAQAEIFNEYEQKINIAIRKYAEVNNYQLILYKDIAYASDSINITDEVTKLMNE